MINFIQQLTVLQRRCLTLVVKKVR